MYIYSIYQFINVIEGDINTLFIVKAITLSSFN
jgi:hypothetical protein